jgi:hypothetical protein
MERLPIHRLVRYSIRTLAQIATDQGFAVAHEPSNDISDWSSLSNCFDQYRISRVDFRITLPRSDAAEFPTLYFAPDFNDSGVPATRADLLNYETLKVHQFAENKRMFTYSYVPKQRITAGTGDVAVAGDTWAHTSQTLTWGFAKMFVTQYNSTSNSTAVLEVHSQIHFEFKNSR